MQFPSLLSPSIALSLLLSACVNLPEWVNDNRQTGDQLAKSEQRQYCRTQGFYDNTQAFDDCIARERKAKIQQQQENSGNSAAK
jgi:hypothetical protein